MDEPEILVGQDFDLQPAGGEEFMEAGKPAFRQLAARVHKGLGLRAAPLLTQSGGGGAGGVHVLVAQAGIANDADRAGDGINGLAGSFQD